MVKAKGGRPFLTETATLYKSPRSNAVDHMKLAYERGFTHEVTGMPIIMADGLMGNEEVAVTIPGQIYQKVHIAALVVKVQGLVLVSHFTGHLATGFGAALKNLGMGCASRRGKMVQHSTAKPSIRIKMCTGCGECVTWCPENAISIVDGKAKIKRKRCIGCCECLAMCRFDAVGYNWSETYENLQKKVVEHAMGVLEGKKGKGIYINFLTRVSKDCDCLGRFEKIVPDIGVLMAFDPVALDAASLDLVEEISGRRLSTMSYDIPCRVQIDYAKEIGFGQSEYELVEI